MPFYERLGFEVVREHRFEPHLPLYVILRRGDVHLHLSEHTGDAPPGCVAYFYVDDVDASRRRSERRSRPSLGSPVLAHRSRRERLRIGTVPVR